MNLVAGARSNSVKEWLGKLPPGYLQWPDLRPIEHQGIRLTHARPDCCCLPRARAAPRGLGLRPGTRGRLLIVRQRDSGRVEGETMDRSIIRAPPMFPK